MVSDERRKVRGVEWGCGGVRGVWTVEFGVISEGRVVRDEGRGVQWKGQRCDLTFGVYYLCV